MNWKVHALGTRGAFPRTGAAYQEYGGDTTCFYVDCGEHVFLDAGSGLVNAASCPAFRDAAPVHLLLSHVHIDHVMGLLMSGLLEDAGREVHIYGLKKGGEAIREQLDILVRPPYWPVGVTERAAEVRFHDLTPDDDFSIGAVRVRTVAACHPNEGILYRLDDGAHSVGYALDHELACDAEGRTEAFFRGCDLLIFDGNDVPGKERPGFGHSTWRQGLDLAARAEIGTLLVTHHGFGHTDEQLAAEEQTLNGEQALRAAKGGPGPLRALFAKEGMVIEL